MAGLLTDFTPWYSTFAFDNSEVINGLKKRGKFIKKEDWDLVEK